MGSSSNKTHDDSHGEENKTNSCIVCEKTFTSTKRLQLHLIKKHSVRSDEMIAAKHKCDKCEKSYTTRANLLIHQRLHTGTTSNWINQVSFCPTKTICSINIHFNMMN